MNELRTITGEGGSAIVVNANSPYRANFYVFVPTEDTVLAELLQGGVDVKQNKTYKAGHRYVARNGYYNQINVTSGEVIIYTGVDQPSYCGFVPSLDFSKICNSQYLEVI